MPRTSRFEQPATVKIISERGDELTASAILRRDPHYLYWNRILVLGTEADMMRAMAVQGGKIVWELHRREDWPGLKRSEGSSHKGSGIIRHVGMTSGISIADQSIQVVADIEILDAAETYELGDYAQPASLYWFLQRSPSWPVYSLNFKNDRQRSGPWYRLGHANLRFRLVSTTNITDDDRVSSEIQEIVLPGAEITPIANESIKAFQEKADVLWFCLRILFMFGLRQFVNPVAESHRFRDRRLVWHTVKLEPRIPSNAALDPVFYAYLPAFVGSAARRLLGMREHYEILHAAAYSYARSFESLTLEGRLTSCVEGLERLVTAYEQSKGFAREIVSRKDWAAITRLLKRDLPTLHLRRSVDQRIRKAISEPIRLSLQERIERFAGNFRHHLRSDDTLLNGLDKMIKFRNDIVHGRVVRDANGLYVESLRARALFEKLFLCWLGCGRVETSGYPQLVISQHYEKREAS